MSTCSSARRFLAAKRWGASPWREPRGARKAAGASPPSRPATPTRFSSKASAKGPSSMKSSRFRASAPASTLLTQWDELERLFIAARCAISNTADRGYETDPDDRPDADPPRSFPAKLAKLLLARHRAGRRADHALSRASSLPATGRSCGAWCWTCSTAGRRRRPARRWVGDECLWVNSLVDRIVSEPLEPLGAVAEPYALMGDRGPARP